MAMDLVPITGLAIDNDGGIVIAQTQDYSIRFFDEARYNQVLARFIADAYASTRVRSVKDALKTLELERLREQAARSGDRESASSAARMLALAFVNTSFYAPRDLLDNRRFAQALLLLDVADSIHDGRAGTALFRARALAQLGQPDRALDALDRAVDGGARAAAFEADSLLEPLRALPRYRAILDKARALSPRSP